MVSACWVFPKTNPSSYCAQGLVAADGKVHFTYRSDENKPVHIAREDRKWVSEDVSFLASVDSFIGFGDELCIYGCGSSACYRGCKPPGGNWEIVRTTRDNSSGTEPNPSSGSSCDVSGMNDTYSWIDKDRFIGACGNSGGSSLMYDLYVLDLSALTSTPYLSPLNVGDLVASCAEGGVPEDSTLEIRVAPFYEDGAWDAVSFVVLLIYAGNNSPSNMSCSYWARNENNAWNTVMMSKGAYDWSEYDYFRPLTDTGLDNLIFMGQRATIIARQAIVKTDKTTGLAYVEPISQPYKAIHKAEATATRDGRKLEFLADVTSSDGKVHALFQDHDDGKHRTVLYYHVYNPNSPSIEDPETIEFIEQQGYR
jgi:hypothetical protein